VAHIALFNTINLLLCFKSLKEKNELSIQCKAMANYNEVSHRRYLQEFAIST